MILTGIYTKGDMNRRSFLLSTLLAPFAAALTPEPFQLKPRSLGMSQLVASSQGFESFPLEPLSAETIKKAWKDLADAAYETQQRDAASFLNNGFTSPPK